MQDQSARPDDVDVSGRRSPDVCARPLVYLSPGLAIVVENSIPDRVDIRRRASPQSSQTARAGYLRAGPCHAVIMEDEGSTNVAAGCEEISGELLQTARRMPESPNPEIPPDSAPKPLSFRDSLLFANSSFTTCFQRRRTPMCRSRGETLSISSTFHFKTSDTRFSRRVLSASICDKNGYEQVGTDKRGAS
jgi:hypothetical protein